MVRQQLRVVALFAVMVLFGFPAPSTAQLVRPPNPNAPMLVIVTFSSADKKTGVDFAETLRDRVSGDISYRELQVQTKANIDATLQASGYDMMAALTEGDANLLAKQLRADEYVEGTINKNGAGNGYTGDARLVLTYNQRMVQPLGNFEGTKPNDVASQISKAFQAAQKVYDEVQKCRSNQRESKPADALAVAQAGIAKYPRSTLLRICQLTVMIDQNKAPADVLKTATEILAIDPKSQLALQAEVDAYDKLGDKEKKITALTQLLAADPTNPKLQQTVVYELAASGKYDIALKIIAKTMEDNPGDVTIAKLYWQLLYANKDYKTMVKVGAEMIKMDTAFADTTYFDRTIEAFRTDSQYANAAEVAAQATKKYSRRADYWAERGQLELKAGQVQPGIASLKHALQIDPKIEGARRLIVNSLIDAAQAAQYDSAWVALHEAQTAGEDPNWVGQTAGIVGGKIFKFVYDSTNNQKTIAGFQRVLPWVTWADSISTDRNTKSNAKFLTGMSHFFIGQFMLTDAIPLKSCDGAKAANEMLVNAQLELPAGGAANGAVLQQLIPAAQSLGTSSEQAMKVFCAPPKKPGPEPKKP